MINFIISYCFYKRPNGLYGGSVSSVDGCYVFDEAGNRLKTDGHTESKTAIINDDVKTKDFTLEDILALISSNYEEKVAGHRRIELVISHET